MGSNAAAGWECEVVERARQIVAAAHAAPIATKPLRLTVKQLAGMIDHTLLKQEATPEMVAKLCEEAREHHFASVCVNPCNVAQCVAALKDSNVLVCSVVGFPLGATLPGVKAFEAQQAIAIGAQEIDMVLNVGALKSGNLALVRDDIAGVVRACHARGLACKVILETCLLTDEEKVAGCLVAVEAGVDFVKTSTGFNTGGATVADVALMRAAVGPKIGVKAAGGIRDYETAMAMIAAGASRLGASAGIKILQGVKA